MTHDKFANCYILTFKIWFYRKLVGFCSKIIWANSFPEFK